MTDEPYHVGCSQCEELFTEDQMKCIDGWWICETCLDYLNSDQFNK